MAPIGVFGFLAAILVTLAVAGTWRLRAGHIRAGDLHVDVTADGAFARDLTGAEMWRYSFAPDYTAAFSGVKISGPWPHFLFTLSPHVGSIATYSPSDSALFTT